MLTLRSSLSGMPGLPCLPDRPNRASAGGSNVIRRISFSVRFGMPSTCLPSVCFDTWLPPRLLLSSRTASPSLLITNNSCIRYFAARDAETGPFCGVYSPYSHMPSAASSGDFSQTFLVAFPAVSTTPTGATSPRTLADSDKFSDTILTDGVQSISIERSGP